MYRWALENVFQPSLEEFSKIRSYRATITAIEQVDFQPSLEEFSKILMQLVWDNLDKIIFNPLLRNSLRFCVEGGGEG